jgi:hypothetical protein
MASYEADDAANDDGSSGVGGSGAGGRGAGASGGNASGNNSYATAMANLAGFPYSGGQVVNSASAAAFLNPNNFSPSYAAAQYNAAIAAGYWPGSATAPPTSSNAGSSGLMKEMSQGNGASVGSGGGTGDKNNQLMPKNGKSHSGSNVLTSSTQI